MNYDIPKPLRAIQSTGVITEPDAAGDLTLPVGTHFIELGGEKEPRTPLETALFSVHPKWNAALAATITFEWTNHGEKLTIPSATTGQLNKPTVDTESNENAGTGNWLQDNIATDTYASPAFGAGNAIAALTITAGGAAAGAIGVQLANRSARRYRLKVVVTTQGKLRVTTHGKLGA